MMYNVAVAALLGVALLNGVTATTTVPPTTASPCVPLDPSELATAGNPILWHEAADLDSNELSLPVLVPVEFTVQGVAGASEHLSAYFDAGEKDSGAADALRAFKPAGVEELFLGPFVPELGNTRVPMTGPLFGRDASCYQYYVLKVLDFDHFVVNSGAVKGNDNAAGFEINGQVNIYFTFEVESERNGVPSTETVERSDVMTFAVSFPKQTSATFGGGAEGPVRVNKVPLIEPLLTLQYVDVAFGADAALNAGARIRIRTQVQQPFRVCGSTVAAVGDDSSALCDTNKAVLTIPAAISDDGTADATLITDCAAVAEVEGVQSLCTQVWEMTFSVKSGVCSVDSTDYAFDVNFRCSQGDADCALSGSSIPDTHEQWAVELDGSNFCGQVVDDVAISASINIFKDAAFATAATAFIEGDRIFVKLVVSSPEADVASSSVAKVELLDVASIAGPIYDGAACVPASLGCAAVAGPGALDASFSFIADAGVLALAADANEFFRVRVTLDIAFSASPLLAQSVQSDMLLQKKTISGDRKTGASLSFEVTGAADTATTAMADESAAPAASTLISAAVAGAVAFAQL